MAARGRLKSFKPHRKCCFLWLCCLFCIFLSRKNGVCHHIIIWSTSISRVNRDRYASVTSPGLNLHSTRTSRLTYSDSSSRLWTSISRNITGAISCSTGTMSSAATAVWTTWLPSLVATMPRSWPLPQNRLHAHVTVDSPKIAPSTGTV